VLVRLGPTLHARFTIYRKCISLGALKYQVQHFLEKMLHGKNL